MNKQLFLGVSLTTLTVAGYSHRKHFEELGRIFDEMDAMMLQHRSHFFDQQDATSYSVKQTDNAVIVTLNTGTKVPADAIDIQTAGHSASITLADAGKRTRITLTHDNGYLVVGMCSRESREVFSGSSCMQQVIPALVDFDTLTAEYAGTELTITIALQEPVRTKTKRVAVTVRDDYQVEPQLAVKKHTKKHKKQAVSAPHDGQDK